MPRSVCARFLCIGEPGIKALPLTRWRDSLRRLVNQGSAG